MPIKKSKFPTIIGVIVLLLGTFLGVFLVNRSQVFKIGASGEGKPKDVRISNITDKSLTVSWVTDIETYGFVVFSGKVEGATKIKSSTHSVDIDGLTPEKKYVFKINSGGTVFDNNGTSWEVTTGPTLQENIFSDLISGSLITATGNPVANALVYADVGGYLASTKTSEAGTFAIQLGIIRTQDLTSFAPPDPSSTNIQIFAETNSQNTSSAQVFSQSAHPIPTMIMGQVQDFRNTSPNQTGADPEATLNLPSTTGGGDSKFNVPDSLQTPPPQNVTLDNVQDGETITTDKPQFFGAGPAKTQVTILVESDNPQETVLDTASNGAWNWTPPENLAPGNHTITISWIDVAGIKRILTRNFVVQASELPAFEASSSGQIATPTPSSSPTRSTSPTSTPTHSPAPVPVTGDLTPTLLFTIMGMGVMSLSFAIWKYSNAQSE